MESRRKEDEHSSKQRRVDESEDHEDDLKNEPISLEELRDKMREREKELSRPTFLTKEQRVQIALQKREEVAKDKMRKLGAIQQEREEIFSGRRTERKEEERKSAAERYLQQRKEDVSQQELDKIKKKYLGAKPQKKKVIKPSEKFKFNFAWDAGEDTAPDTNPLYDKPYEAQLLFGRGFRAGIDSREQIQKQIDYEEISKDRKEKVVERGKDDKRRKEKELAKEQREREERAAAKRRRLRELHRLKEQGKLDEEEQQELDEMVANDALKQESLREPQREEQGLRT